MKKCSFIPLIGSIDRACSSLPSEACYSHHQHIIHKRFPISTASVKKHRFLFLEKDHKLIRLHNFILCWFFIPVEAEVLILISVLRFTGQICDTTCCTVSDGEECGVRCAGKCCLSHALICFLISFSFFSL